MAMSRAHAQTPSVSQCLENSPRHFPLLCTCPNRVQLRIGPTYLEEQCEGNGIVALRAPVFHTPPKNHEKPFGSIHFGSRPFPVQTTHCSHVSRGCLQCLPYGAHDLPGRCEQGDPLIPMLHSLGQHRALGTIDRSPHPTETLVAFLDDVFAVTPGPDRVGAIHGSIQKNMWVHSSIRIDGGKTQVWNGAGVKPAIC